MRTFMIGVFASLGIFPIQASLPAAAQTLSGQITSAEEGPMEGVLVSARRAGSTITITVATTMMTWAAVSPYWKLRMLS